MDHETSSYRFFVNIAQDTATQSLFNNLKSLSFRFDSNNKDGKTLQELQLSRYSRTQRSLNVGFDSNNKDGKTLKDLTATQSLFNNLEVS